MKKNDILLIIILLIMGLGIGVGYGYMHRENGTYVLITVDSKEYKRLPLDKNTQVDIPGANGGTNRLIIKNGEATISQADCPDKLCVHQAAIKKNGESLVCLPHKVVIKVIADNTEKPADIDAIAK